MSDARLPIRSLREEAGLGGGDEVDRALAGLVEEGRRSWPGLQVSVPSFLRHVARHLPDLGAPGAHLSALHAADLYLACACGERAPGAVEAFLSRHEADLDAALRGLNVPPAQRDELRQEVLEKLIVGRTGAPPKIGDYAGRGPLGGWVRVATIRTALNALKQKRHDHLTAGAELDDAREHSAPDPELAFLKAHYRDEVSQALKDAFAGLPADERNVLRLYFLDGLGIDKIAAVYGVHRATAARWVTRGREALLKGMQELLGQRLGIERAEVESVVGIVRSQLHLAVSSLFRE
ncbi:transcriptional regulator [Sorangium cellulosum]|uniref:Transcriptional regulator n=1 Tax=Sorangium cellulosum TaxID=56 RepID=A0A2L0EJD2_SORCE|nr:sigma-70 family RNA polymerase sigma factor [Sorangium cellulosum]AUX39398.1 transcriptional regulator [Sorangium cellulosum]